MSFAVEKTLFNIGKEVLHFISKPIPTQRIEQTIKKDCSGCINNTEISNKYIQDYCSNYCSKCIQTVSTFKNIIKPLNIKKRVLIKSTSKQNFYNIKNIDITALVNSKKTLMSHPYLRFSLTQIKHLITYYYYCDSKGFIKNISKKKLANIINCTTKTIDNNNKLFQKLGIFIMGRKEKGYFSGALTRYKDNFKKDGKGYIVMSLEIYKSLLQITSVNALRLTIQGIIKNDINHKFNKNSIFKIEEIKNILPKKSYSLKGIQELVEHCIPKDIFSAVMPHNYLLFSVKKDFIGRNIKDKNSKIFKNNFTNILGEYSINIKDIDKQINDLVSLSFEYTFDTVKFFLLEILIMNIDIKNLGGLVRNEITNYLDLNKSFFEETV